MCDQQRLRSTCAYAQTDQSLFLLLKYSMSVKLLAVLHLEFLSLKGDVTGSSESTLVKCHIVANHMSWLIYRKVSCRMAKPTNDIIWTASTLIRLEVMHFQVHCEDSDQTGKISWQTWVFAGHVL